MTRTVADVLRDALVDADRRGLRSPTLERLSPSDGKLLAEQTVAFLRTRPSRESTIPGWRQVGSFEAGVNRWWSEQIDFPATSETDVPLRKLRAQIYDYLDDELGLISKEPGQNAAIHLSPIGEVLAPDQIVDAPREIFIGPGGAGFGEAAKNRIVELAAMRRVVEHFEGWEHMDVSLQKVGWDLTFIRGADERHVEVKGVSGRRPSVLLTRNEVDKAASDPFWSLAVVTQALVAPVVHEFSEVFSPAASVHREDDECGGGDLADSPRAQRDAA